MIAGSSRSSFGGISILAAGVSKHAPVHAVAGDSLVPPLWQDAASDVPPEDALKQAVLQNNPIAPEGRSTGRELRRGHQQGPGSHQAIMGTEWPCTLGCNAPGALWQHQCLLHLRVSLSETLVELSACLNTPGVYFGCCC